MQKKNSINMTNKRIVVLMAEVLRGEHIIDTLPNSSFDFAEEQQAIYFSNARKNMKSEMAYATMHSGQQLNDLKILEVLQKNE